jgi:GNAT superfamily N-acetyltransferase
MLNIRPATEGDHGAIWSIIGPVIREGETYTLPRDMSEAEAMHYWTGPDRHTFVAEEHGVILGTYFVRANQLGGGSHVANCGYMTRADARHKGVARAMCEHSLAEARRSGFRAMQFNFVVSTNERAVPSLARPGVSRGRPPSRCVPAAKWRLCRRAGDVQRVVGNSDCIKPRECTPPAFGGASTRSI